MPPHEATTAQLGALYPGVAGPNSPVAQVLIGRQASGELFCFDPFELYRIGVITNPNIAVFGQIGRGKSSFVKTFLFRQAAFGRRLVVLDPKGEYAPLAHSLGCAPLEFKPGGHFRVNPIALDPALGSRVEQRRGALRAAGLVANSVLGRELTPGEHMAVELALDQTCGGAGPSLPSIASALLEPQKGAVSAIRSSVEEVRREGRDVAFELRRFITGELGGLFDDGNGSAFDLDAPALIVDLSGVYRSAALGPAVTCIQLAVEARLRAAGGRQTLMVVDEAWAVLANSGTARFLQSSFKLARSLGVANLVVAHRVSDLAATGATGSVVAQLSEGLLADCETVVCYAQSEREVLDCTAALGLSGVERALVTTLRRGTALWHVGRERFLVEHRLSPFEKTMVDTDSAMGATP